MKKYFFILFVCLFQIKGSSQENVIDSLKLLLKSAKHDTSKCNILNQMIENESDDAVWSKYNEEMAEIARRNLQKTSLSGAVKKAFSKYLANTYNNEGYLQSNLGNLNGAIDAYYKCIRVQADNKDFQGVSFSYICIGRLIKIQGEYAKTIEFFKKALDLSTAIKDNPGIARALFFLGDVYDTQGNISESLECYLKSLKISESIKDEAGTADCYNNIALIYEKQDEYDKALSYHQKSLAINKKINNKFSVATALNNIGLCYFKKGDLKQAEDFYNKSLIFYAELNDVRSSAFVYVNLGTIYQKQNDLEKAMRYFEKSLKIRQELGEKSGIAQCLTNIATIYLAQGKIKEAENNAVAALKISQEIGFVEKTQSAARILFQIYEKQGKGMEALKMHKLYIVMRDSLKNLTSQKALISQNLKYEYEKKAAADSVRVQEEKRVISAQLKQEKTQRFALYGGLALVIVFSVFMANRFIVTRKQKRIIEIKEQETQQKNVIISQQKHLVEEKQKEILDSINYAKRIQHTLLAHADFLKEHLSDHFVYFNPKDIVSGDFYWATSVSRKQSPISSGHRPPSANCDLFYLAVCDSTGHGVPGAFMSLLNIGFLNEAINEKNILEPNEILNFARERLTNSISKEGQKDGFDGILMRFELEGGKIKSINYAAANNAPLLITGNEYLELPKDRMPVGKGEKNESFKLYEVKFNPGDTIYLYTDGFADQFGGPNGKKFKYKQLNELLLNSSQHNMPEQTRILESSFEQWKGNLEQVDDVLLIGIKLS